MFFGDYTDNFSADMPYPYGIPENVEISVSSDSRIIPDAYKTSSLYEGMQIKIN